MVDRLKERKEGDRIALEEMAYEVRVNPENKDKHRIYLRCCEVYKMQYGEEFYIEIDERENGRI